MNSTDDKPRKMTKAESGRLGGLKTKETHGTEHFARIGALGFQALRRKFGYMGGSGLGALRWLNRHNRIPIDPAETARFNAAAAELIAEFFPEDGGENGR